MSPRTLYWVNGSIPSWQVMLALHEKGLAFDSHRLRVMGATRETRAPDFLAMSPRGEAPVLTDQDGTIVVVESLAILHYVEATAPIDAPRLLPTAPAALARCLGRLYSVERLRAAYRPVEQLFRPETLDDARRAAARAAPAAVASELAIWEAWLAAAPFAAGEALTLADCVLYPAVGYQLRRGLLLEGLPHLRAYVDRMGARPAAQAARPAGWTKERGRRDLFAEAARC